MLRNNDLDPGEETCDQQVPVLIAIPSCGPALISFFRRDIHPEFINEIDLTAQLDKCTIIVGTVLAVACGVCGCIRAKNRKSDRARRDRRGIENGIMQQGFYL